MEYELIEKANKEIITTDIKGKAYAEVNQRIKAFRMVYPTGFILTEYTDENGVCKFRAMCGYYGDDSEKIILGTGTAYEKENSTYINKTSYIENCETSAVGRALGMAGFGIDTSVASAEEVQNAIKQQEDSNRPLKKGADYYVCDACGVSTFGSNKRTAAELKKSSADKFGVPLCPKCAQTKLNEVTEAELAKVEAEQAAESAESEVKNNE